MAYVRALIFCCIALASINHTFGSETPKFNISEFMDMFSNFSLPFFGGGRTRRDTESAADNHEGHPEGHPEDHQDRFFFARFPTITSCNTTTQGGRSCLNCRQALNCLANNLGLLTSCRGLFQYCDQGRCVFNRPSNCTG